MIDVFDETKDKDSPNGARELGWLSAQLVEALARQAGEPTPRILKTNVSFLNEELKGFDTLWDRNSDKGVRGVLGRIGARRYRGPGQGNSGSSRFQGELIKLARLVGR